MADNPIHIPAVFAVNGLKNVIQKVRQVGQAIQDFTWVDGTPAVTMIDKADGGLAPKGQDFNGVLNALSEHTVFNQNGGRYKWSQDVIDNYGGYSKDFIIQSDNGVSEFISLVDNNTVNPNLTLGTSWAVYAGQGSIPEASSTTSGIMRVLNVLNSSEVAAAASAATVKLLNDTKLAVSDVVNNLTTTATNRALSAAQGKVLNDIFNSFEFQATKNGYIKIPFGSRKFVAQWASVSITAPNAEVNFPIAFPNTCLSLIAGSGEDVSSAAAEVMNVIPNTTTRFGFRANASVASTYTYLAIGY